MNIDFAPLGVLPKTGTLVLLAAADGRLGGKAGELDEKCGGVISRSIRLAGDKFKRGTIDLVCPAGLELDRIVICATDDLAEARPFELESLGGRIAQKLGSLGVKQAHLVVDAGPKPAELAIALALGARLRAYRFDKYRKTLDEEGDASGNGVAGLTVLLDDPDGAKASWRTAAAIAAGVEQGRDLVSEPANVLTPARFADACRALSKEVGLEVEVLDRAAMQKLGMNALLGVARGSVEPPFLVVMHWNGGAAGEPPVALVGKGVCFDTGGISLKPAAGMEEMKWDMGGGAAVFGAMKAIAGRKARVNVVGVLGLVENMPSGSAQRPGDVVTAMSGTTIEVVNTDAEGRLVLADALHYTVDRFKPRAVVDMATLTGAVIVALGNEQGGLFANDDALADKVSAAGELVGERVWRLPLGDDYMKHIKSDIADIKNVGRAREAGATAGAVFLQRFVDDVPWAHVDIAGVAWSKRDLPLAAKGATGFGIRLLDRLVADNYEG